MARSPTEALSEEAAEVTDWEREQEAWNLPRARSASVAGELDEDEGKAPGGDPGEPSRSRAMPRQTQ